MRFAEEYSKAERCGVKLSILHCSKAEAIRHEANWCREDPGNGALDAK